MRLSDKLKFVGQDLRSRRSAGSNKVKTMRKSKDTLAQTSTRVAQVERKTKETDVRVKLDLDGRGQSRISTGLPFLDHMLELFVGMDYSISTSPAKATWRSMTITRSKTLR